MILKWLAKRKAKKIQDPIKREKAHANINKEPWVSVVSIKFVDPNNPTTGYFELDWNKYFIKQLIESGYSGRTDEDVVEMWFNDLCRGVINQDPE